MLRSAAPWLRVALLQAGWLPLLLGACAGLRPPAPATALVAWDQRLPALQRASEWSLQGRAAASAGTQGWQASLTWRQAGSSSELHLAGPLGVGASVLRLTPDGLSIDGASAGSDAERLLQDRLGMDLPLASLRYWILGVPDPGSACEITRNAQDRAQRLVQSGWTIDIGRYLPVGRDWLPGQLTVARDAVRLRIAVDHWEFPP
jgi:outer membrane lipoprotein LolB